VSDRQKASFSTKISVVETFGLSLAEVRDLELWQYAMLCEEVDRRVGASNPPGGNARGTPVMR